MAILKDISLGENKLEIGLQLRQAMLLNKILFNVSDDDLKSLVTIDQYLLRSLVEGHSKAPLEFRYLESGATAIRHLVSSRRLIYLQAILKRSDTELTKRILIAQKNDPSPGDFVKLVEKDLKNVDINMDYKQIQEMSVEPYKKMVKKKVREAAFRHFKTLQAGHSKIMNIQYDELKCQPYMLSTMFTNLEVNLLHALRSRSVDCKINFRRLHGDDLDCPLCSDGCQDDQPHILQCKKLRMMMKSEDLANSNVRYDNIFGNLLQQKEVTVMFAKLLQIRKTLTKEDVQYVEFADYT